MISSVSQMKNPYESLPEMLISKIFSVISLEKRSSWPVSVFYISSDVKRMSKYEQLHYSVNSKQFSYFVSSPKSCLVHSSVEN